jgi:hypothetical protein
VIVHSYYYGPVGNGGLDFQTTQGLTSVVNEDIIRELYSKDGSPSRAIQFSKIYQTLQGPVIGCTRIEPSQSRDKRQTVVNRTFFVRLEDVSFELFRLMDAPTTFPVEPLKVTLQVEPNP